MPCLSSFSGFPFLFISSYLNMKEALNCAFWLGAGGCRILNFHTRANPRRWRLLQSWRHAPGSVDVLICPGCPGWIYISESVLRILKMYPLIFDSENPLTLGGDLQRPSLWQAGRGLFGLLICFQLPGLFSLHAPFHFRPWVWIIPYSLREKREAG